MSNPRADRADEADLFHRYSETGDRALRNELAEHYRGLAISLATRFAHHGEPLDDLVQVAMLGLVRAVDRFDPYRGISFTSFATPTILGELRRHFRDHTWALKVPRPVKDVHLRIRPVINELRGELSRAPTVPEVAERAGCSTDEVLRALDADRAYRTTPLSRPVGGDSDAPRLEERLGVDDDNVARFEVIDTVRSLIDRLPEREQEVLRMRFYEDLTQSEIASRLGVSQMQISRTLRNVLERLRNAPGVRD